MSELVKMGTLGCLGMVIALKYLIFIYNTSIDNLFWLPCLVE